MDPFTQVKSAKYRVKSRTKSISDLGTFSNFRKLNVQSIIFSKFPHKIEAAAICFAMERGRRKSQQNSRICVRGQIKLVYPVQKICLTHPKSWMIGRSKELEDLGRVASSFPTYAPINVKPAGERGGGGAQGIGWRFDCLCCPWGRAFDLSCSPGEGDI